ncbi:MAG: right-handed parallel beta-helix repeat-containing protein [Promethearchaeia archaeon]
MERKLLLCLIFVMFIISLPEGESSDSKNATETVPSPKRRHFNLGEYSSHTPIAIANDSDFKNQSWPGSGKAGDPYIIEGLQIASNDTCISIQNVTSHFIVQECYLLAESSILGTGIQMRNVTNGRLEGCVITSKQVGIELIDSKRCRVCNNTVSRCDNGMKTELCFQIEVKDNYLEETGSSIDCYYLLESEIMRNTVTNTLHPWMTILGRGDKSVVADNELRGSGMNPVCSGINVISARNWQVINNTLSGTYAGMAIHGKISGCKISNNTMTDNHIGVYVSVAEDAILDDNRVLGANRSFWLAYSENITIRSNSIENAKTSGIELFRTNSSTVVGNQMSVSGMRIEGYLRSNWIHTIANNTVDGQSITYLVNIEEMILDTMNYGQLILVECRDVEVRSRNLSNSTVGLQMAFCSGCRVTGCIINDNQYEAVTMSFNQDCVLSRCTIKGNGQSFGHDYHSGAITLLGTNNTRITENLIVSNGGAGVLFKSWSSRRCLLYNNLIANNTGYGVHIGRALNTTIYGNGIGWNKAGNARDNGRNNTWDNGHNFGNWWSDYDGSGVYEIEGYALSIDHYPMTLTTYSENLPIPVFLGIELPTLILLSLGGIATVIVIFLLAKEFSDIISSEEGNINLELLQRSVSVCFLRPMGFGGL